MPVMLSGRRPTVTVMRWYTADLHLGHDNIRGYSGRPYSTVDAMDRDLLARWSEAVDADDTVWVLGDLALGPIEQTLELVAQLPGTKVLVPGNHDRCWAGRRARAKHRVEEWRARYQQAGLTIVDAPHTVELGGQPVLVDHFPYLGDSTDEPRHEQWRPADNGGWLLHGHVHTRWRQRGRMINVGVDAWAGRPVAEDTLAALVAAAPADAAPLRWQRP